MKQYCTACGREMTYYQQNQQWYCQACRNYAAAPMYAAPQPMYVAPPPMPDEHMAMSKIYSAMRMRDVTDKIIPTSWAFVILAFQMLVPILTLVMLYLWIVEIDLNFSASSTLFVGLAMFLAAIAMVIVQAALVYKLVERRDEHFRRDGLMRQGMIEYLDAMSVKEKKDINVERWTMNSMNYSLIEVDRGAGIWALLTGLVTIIPVIGIFAILYCLHFLTKDTQEHDRRQRDFNTQFQLAMLKLGKTNSISYDWYPLPRRDSAIYIIVTILTLGFALPYWWYVNIVDMNTHFNNQWMFESQIIRMIKEEVPDEVPAKP